jgi:hypothetical protein
LIVISDDLADGQLPLAGLAIDKQIIWMCAGQKRSAARTLTTRFKLVARTVLAQQAFGETTGEKLLADPLRPHQQVGLCQSTAFDGPSKHLDLVEMTAKTVPDRSHLPHLPVFNSGIPSVVDVRISLTVQQLPAHWLAGRALATAASGTTSTVP